MSQKVSWSLPNLKPKTRTLHFKQASIRHEYKPTNNLKRFSLWCVIGEILSNKNTVKSNCYYCKKCIVYKHATCFGPEGPSSGFLQKYNKKVGQSCSGNTPAFPQSFIFLLFTNRQSNQKKGKGCCLTVQMRFVLSGWIRWFHFHTSLRLFVTQRSTDFVITDIRVTETTMKWSSTSRDLFYGVSVPIRRKKACHVRLTPKPPPQISFDILTLLCG